MRAIATRTDDEGHRGRRAEPLAATAGRTKMPAPMVALMIGGELADAQARTSAASG